MKNRDEAVHYRAALALPNVLFCRLTQARLRSNHLCSGGSGRLTVSLGGVLTVERNAMSEADRQESGKGKPPRAGSDRG
jgi:hypothetical protein